MSLLFFFKLAHVYFKRKLSLLLILKVSQTEDNHQKVSLIKELNEKISGHSRQEQMAAEVPRTIQSLAQESPHLSSSSKQQQLSHCPFIGVDLGLQVQLHFSLRSAPCAARPHSPTYPPILALGPRTVSVETSFPFSFSSGKHLWSPLLGLELLCYPPILKTELSSFEINPDFKQTKYQTIKKLETF